MSSKLKEFLARAKAPPAKPIINTGQPVSREEFGAIVSVVEALVDDVQAATSPEKLAAVFNAALKSLDVPAPAANRVATIPGKYRAPGDDDEANKPARDKFGYAVPAGD